MISPRRSPLAWPAIILFWGVFATINQAVACATVFEPTITRAENFITSERAIIIWDEEHKIEHFIRQANFSTESPNMGFLVPTPQTPELVQVNEGIFDMATALGEPVKVPPTNYRSPWALISPFVLSSFLHLDRLNPATWSSALNQPKFAPRSGSVVTELDVAGYHATVLAAEDEQSMSAWLAANGYLSTPELKAWLKPYVAAKWKINAFKLVKRDDRPVLTTSAIRLSFPTDRPFYPYSEPNDQQQANAASPLGRALRVTILSNERMTGRLANDSPWPKKLEFAGSSISTSSSKSLTRQQWLAFASLDDPNQHTLLPAQLTTFIDESNPRPGTADLYFSRDPDQSPFKGTVVDLTLTPQNRLTLTHSVVDVVAFLVLIILPCVPLYCGWRVLNQKPEKKPVPPAIQQILESHGRAETVVAPKLWTRAVDGIIGMIAIVLGLYYGVQVVLILAGEIASAFLGWSDTSGYWIWIFLGLLMAIILVAAMSWGVIFCGINVLRNRSIGLPIRRTNFFYAEGARQGLMGGLSFFAGCAALLPVESVLVSLF